MAGDEIELKDQGHPHQGGHHHHDGCHHEDDQ